jgi:hypothetical protein
VFEDNALDRKVHTPSLLSMQSKLRFALSEESVNGLRFARFCSQKVGAPLRRRNAFVASPGSSKEPRSVEAAVSSSQFQASRRMLRLAMSTSTKFVPFGNQRPNPSVEGMAKRLRLLPTPHLAR